MLPRIQPTAAAGTLTAPLHRQAEGSCSAPMFLTIRHDDDSSLVEALDLSQLFDPFQPRVLGRLHAGEELQAPRAGRRRGGSPV